MKYIDSEKLIAEIERRIEETKSMKPAFDQFWAGQISAFKGVLKIITSLQQEQPEVDLDAIVNEAFDKYSSVDGYGQLSVSFNRAELYSFIKKIARKEE